MINEKLAKRIFDEALAASSADETLVMVTGGKSALTRFCNNYIHQNVMQKDYTVTVVTAFGKQVGVASSNLFDRGELERIVDVASTVAKRQKEDPMWEPLSEQLDYRPPENTYDEATIEKDHGEKAEMVRQMISPCKSAQCKTAGALTNGDNLVAVATSHGLFAYHCWTSADLTLTVETEDGASGWSEACANRLSDIDIKLLTARALEKAQLARNPITLEPGKYNVILEPPATATLLRYMSVVGFGGLAFNEGRSFLSGKMGEKVMGDNITIRDDFNAGARKGFPFDFEGFPRKAVTIIDKGVAKGVVHSRRTAAKAQTENTGHALPYPSIYGPIPLNVHLEGGNVSREDQLKSLDNGLLLTRTWYESIVDPKLPSITGMSRDGTYLVENGEIKAAIKNIRFNEDMRDLFCRTESLSKEVETTKGWGAIVTAPAILVKDFNITGQTK